VGIPALSRVIENDSHWETLIACGNLRPFSESTIEFAAQLSSSLLSKTSIRQFPELVALAFWLRRSNVTKMVSTYTSRENETQFHLPRGLVLHISPANVDTIFVYSWIVSLLCGNRNILRVPSRLPTQILTLLDCIDAVLGDSRNREIKERVSLVRYPANDEITQILSNHADVRVIWGGDETVQRIRRLPIPPTSIDIAFANKWSLTVIRSSYWNQLSDQSKTSLARSFLNDLMQFGQAACSSPRCIIWLTDGTSSDDIESFWTIAYEQLDSSQFEFSHVDFVNKLVSGDLLAANGLVKIGDTKDNRITRLLFDSNRLKELIECPFQCDSGFLLETKVDTLRGLFQGIGRKVQTITSAGITSKEWKALLCEELPQGIDRIVPIGHALDFSIEWDGYYLFDSFLRSVALSDLKL
jgi:hypothetical protein